MLCVVSCGSVRELTAVYSGFHLMAGVCCDRSALRIAYRRDLPPSSRSLVVILQGRHPPGRPFSFSQLPSWRRLDPASAVASRAWPFSANKSARLTARILAASAQYPDVGTYQCNTTKKLAKKRTIAADPVASRGQFESSQPAGEAELWTSGDRSHCSMLISPSSHQQLPSLSDPRLPLSRVQSPLCKKRC